MKDTAKAYAQVAAIKLTEGFDKKTIVVEAFRRRDTGRLVYLIGTQEVRDVPGRTDCKEVAFTPLAELITERPDATYETIPDTHAGSIHAGIEQRMISVSYNDDGSIKEISEGDPVLIADSDHTPIDPSKLN